MVWATKVIEMNSEKIRQSDFIFFTTNLNFFLDREMKTFVILNYAL
jgi:hypothetical protein